MKQLTKTAPPTLHPPVDPHHLWAHLWTFGTSSAKGRKNPRFLFFIDLPSPCCIYSCAACRCLGRSQGRLTIWNTADGSIHTNVWCKSSVAYDSNRDWPGLWEEHELFWKKNMAFVCKSCEKARGCSPAVVAGSTPGLLSALFPVCSPQTWPHCRYYVFLHVPVMWDLH